MTVWSAFGGLPNGLVLPAGARSNYRSRWCQFLRAARSIARHSGRPCFAHFSAKRKADRPSRERTFGLAPISTRYRATFGLFESDAQIRAVAPRSSVAFASTPYSRRASIDWMSPLFAALISGGI